MSDIEFRYFMYLLMVSDPWPLDSHAYTSLHDLADNEAKKRGYDGWIEAYHRFMG
jgi:hypothetical protein